MVRRRSVARWIGWLAGRMALVLVVVVVGVVATGWRGFGHRATGARKTRMHQSPQWVDARFVNPQPLRNDLLGGIFALREVSADATPRTGNDNYTRDLKENLDAVLDAVVDAGYVDRDKMGIGGHSYGAFSTVNAMTLVPYFKAGIAGDGMCNRTLTLFGFQSELATSLKRRTRTWICHR